MTSVKSLAKLVVGALPGALPVLVADLLNQLRLPEYRAHRSFERRMMRRLGDPARVMSGPFAGMPYGQIAYHSRYLPKILGTYEKEIHPFLERILAMRPGVIIDIGAAEGFYAAGLAWRDPTVHIVAFEAERPARALLRASLRVAGVGAQVDIRGPCTRSSLTATLRENRERPIILCDCEGAEDTLLDPGVVTELRAAVVLVETHDMKVPGVAARLRERFRGTHHIDSALSRLRTLEDYPGPAVEDSDALGAMFERAPGQEYLFMVPRY